MTTELDQLLKELADAKSFFMQRMEEGIAPLREETQRVSKGLLDAQEIVRRMQRERAARVQDGRLRVAEGPLAGLDMLDLKLLHEVMAARVSRGLSGQRSLASITEARKALREALSPERIMDWHDGAFKRRDVGWAGGMPKLALDKFQQSLGSWARQMIGLHQKASLDSTTAAAGDELVPTFEAAELWMDVNLDTLVLPLFAQTPMPTNPFDIPKQLGDTNWYPTSENIQALTTAPATGKTTLTAYGLKTGVPFSDELEEDAIIALIPELRASLVRNAAEVIDDVLLNADTTLTNGINSDGATISTSTAGKAQYLLGFDGMIHLPLVDNTAKSIAKAAAIDADIFNRLLATMGKYAVPRRRGEVVYITDVNTALRALSITEFETVDVAGMRATLSTGEIVNVYGKPLIQSEMMVLADANDGKITNAGNATDTGRILCVNTTQWRVGFRRQITVETEREAGKGQTTMYVSMRIAFTERTGTRSTATHTAVAYHITGVN